MNRAWISALLLLSRPLHACVEHLDPRRPPVENEAKQGTADYKLENSLMMALRDEARAGRAPPRYWAETARAEWPGARGDDVWLTGPGETISIHRRASGCWVRVLRKGVTRERWIPPGGFLDVFPWHGPGVGLLTCLVEGLRANPDLAGFERVAN